MEMLCGKGMKLETGNWLGFCYSHPGGLKKVEIETGGHLRENIWVQPKGSSDPMNIETKGEGRIWDDLQNSSASEKKNKHMSFSETRSIVWNGIRYARNFRWQGAREGE